MERNSIVLATPAELRVLVREAVRTELSVFAPKKEIQEILNEKQAALYIEQKPGTLRQWRTLSKGPAYHKKDRRIFYKKSDLDVWMAQGRKFTSETPDAPY